MNQIALWKPFQYFLLGISHSVVHFSIFNILTVTVYFGRDVQWPAIKTSHHFSGTSKSKCVINDLMTLTFKGWLTFFAGHCTT
jgi:hypothetical protein